MPYIYFPTFPDTIGVGRTATNVSYHHDDGTEWVGEVDEVLAGEKELGVSDYETIVATTEAYNDAIPEPVVEVPVKPVPVAERVATALEESKLPDDIKAALGGVIAELLA